MTYAAKAFPQPDALGLYFDEIKSHELLTREQEKMLARRYQESDDYAAVDRLVRANLRLVVTIAREFYRSSERFSLGDLIQEGNVGLVYAVKKYDPERKTKFSYYARFWIKAFIYKYLMDNYSLVRIGKTQAQRKLFYNLQKVKEKLRQEGRSGTAEQVAERLGVSITEVEQMERRLNGGDQTLNESYRTRSQEQIVDNLRTDDNSLEDSVGDHQMVQMMNHLLSKFKPHLNRREREILEKRIVAEDPVTLQKLGDRFGVSRERIRQIEANIISKLRVFLQDQIPDFENYLSQVTAE